MPSSSVSLHSFACRFIKRFPAPSPYIRRVFPYIFRDFTRVPLAVHFTAPVVSP